LSDYLRRGHVELRALARLGVEWRALTDGKPVVALVRVATVAPWGAKVFLAVCPPLSRQEIAPATPSSARAAASLRPTAQLMPLSLIDVPRR
jgi:hypothetical protein